MLQSLHISNYALIDNVDIEFQSGFNIITGETGAGKSIMLDALSLLLGARADSRSVGRPEKKSVIEAVFQLSDVEGLKDFCLENDIEWDDERCILRREISPNGRSRAFVNDSPVPLTRLQGVALRLVDIHSQHENQLLAQPAFQMQILDTLAGNGPKTEVFSRRYAAFREAMAQLKAMRQQIERTRSDEEFLRFQLQQIDAVNPAIGELDDLEREREVLANAAEIKEAFADALELLSDGTHNISDQLGEASDACLRLSAAIGDMAPELADRLDACMIEVKDIASTLRSAEGDFSGDPAMLDSIDDRILAIRTLMSKHRFDTVERLVEFRDELKNRLDSLDDSQGTLAELERNARRAHALAKETAREISASRKEAAMRFADQLKELAVPLGMKNLECDIRVEPCDMNSTGIDNVEFLFAFNKNQKLMSVGQSASGGEISRLMLTIKCIVADKMNLPSIIFDEIDTGVSGDVANRMGNMMRDISQNIQVIAITHLPQIAAKGNAHFKVYKMDDDTATHTHIDQLSPADRVDEIATMLSGNPADPAARKAAAALLKQN